MFKSPVLESWAGVLESKLLSGVLFRIFCVQLKELYEKLLCVLHIAVKFVPVHN
jgi:hypothetical protein